MLLKILRELVSTRASESTSRQQPSRGITEEPEFRKGGEVLAFTSGSEGDALGTATAEILELLKPYCADYCLIDLRSPTWEAQLVAALKRPIWFAISFFGSGEWLTNSNGNNLWESARIPFVRMYGDTPAYFPKRHTDGFLTSINAYPYREHSAYFEYCCRSKILTTMLQPVLHGMVDEIEMDFEQKRRGKIIFPKNGNDPEALRDYWRLSLPEGPCNFLLNASEAFTSADALDQPFLPEQLRNLGKDLLRIDILNNERVFHFLYAQTDDYIRRHKSTLIARSLLRTPVEVRGVNWGHVDFSNSKATLITDSSYHSTKSLLSGCLAVLDMSPNTTSNPHDRTLRAAACYTAFLTNTQDYFCNFFPNHSEFTFKFNRESIRELVERHLANPQATVELGRIQGQIAREKIGTDRFIKHLLAAVDLSVLTNSGRPAGTQSYVDYS